MVKFIIIFFSLSVAFRMYLRNEKFREILFEFSEDLVIAYFLTFFDLNFISSIMLESILETLLLVIVLTIKEALKMRAHRKLAGNVKKLCHQFFNTGILNYIINFLREKITKLSLIQKRTFLVKTLIVLIFLGFANMTLLICHMYYWQLI